MLDSGVISGRTPRPVRRRTSRRHRLLTRGAPVVVVAAASFAAGITLATAPARSERRLVVRYVTAWRRGDVPAMYAMLDAASRARVTARRFASRLSAAADTATVRSMTVGHVDAVDRRTARVTMDVTTRLWGRLRETLALPLTGRGAAARVHLESSMLFPGLRPGEALTRATRMPARATLRASDGTPLAQGPARSSPIPDVAAQIVGRLGPIPAARSGRYRALGYPPTTRVGLDGLERIFQSSLAGRPGGTLLAGHRVLARAAPAPGASVTTTIDPALERAAVASLGGRYAGIAVMDPRTGGLRALAGIAFDAPQPPGSTMKIVTATAALQARLVTLGTSFPLTSSTTLDGYTMQNAGGERCGGTLINAFAVSCNSVFAPLGARVGAARLVATARRYGFDRPSSIPGAAESTIPSAAAIGDALAVGSSAIGQGKVLATPLTMSDVAATIADGGRRPIPTLRQHARPRFVDVTSPTVAGEVQQMMVAVIRYGTGVPAQIPGVTVAGKTGTAELTNTGTGARPGASSNPRNTDAWFVAYAPVGHPRVVVAALFPGAGYGAATAAPAVRQTIEAALAGG